MVRLREMARIARAGYDAGAAAVEGDRDRAAGRLVRGVLPAVADVCFGQGAGALLKVGGVLAGQALTAALDPAVDAEFTVGEDRPCTVCGPQYRPAGEARLVAYVKAMASGIVYIIGRRGTGKTALTMRLGDLWDRPTRVMGVPPAALPAGWRAVAPPHDLRRTRQPDPAPQVVLLPDGTRAAATPADAVAADPFYRWLERTIPQRSTLLIDDAGLVLDSQAEGSAGNRALKQLVMIVRHLEVCLVVNTQYAAAVSRYVLDADIMLFKPPPRWWERIERPEFHALYTRLSPWWQRLSDTEQRRHAWAISPVYEGPIHIQLPTFWTEALSVNKRLPQAPPEVVG